MERLTIKKAAARLGVARTYIYKLVKLKKLKLYRDQELGVPYLLAADVALYAKSDRKPGRKSDIVQKASTNSYESINDDDSTVYDFFTD